MRELNGPLRQYGDTTAMIHLFTYGSLMFSDVWSRVVQGRYQGVPATLAGYTRKRVKGEHYPVMYRSSPSKSVTGIAYLDLNDADMRRLDTFEGAFYERKEETVILSNEERLPVQVYVLNPAFSHIVSEMDWDPEHFKNVTIHTFLKAYIGLQSSNEST